MKIYLIAFIALISNFHYDTPKEFLNKKWVLISYTHPHSNEMIVYKEKDYLYGCHKKFVIEFKKGGKLVTILNDKRTFVGKYYFKKGGKIGLSPRVSSILLDTSDNCQLDGGSERLIFNEILGFSESFILEGAQLVFEYRISNNEGMGKATFVEYKKIDDVKNKGSQ